jgi:negative regulator of sigma E activity
MPLNTFLHNFLNVLVQIANNTGLQQSWSRYHSARDNLVSEAYNWILSDFVRYTTEKEQGLQQIMESLLARQEEAAIRQEGAAAQAAASLQEINKQTNSVAFIPQANYAD